MADHPLLTADPKASYLAHAAEIRAAIDRVLASGHYILGPEVEAFEREFATAQGGGHVIGVANGTEAIELALRAIGVQRGDAVATVANTVSATAAAIEQIGARLTFVEIDAATMVMSAATLERALVEAGGTIKAIVPVHLYGHPAPMPAIVELAQRHGAKVIEDCAQSHGALVAGRPAGAWGDAAAYSFYPTKNLGAIGDGGAVYTRDAELAERVQRLRQYGWRQRYVSEEPGRNSRLDELQAAILRVKLGALAAENETRRKLAARYLERLGQAAAAGARRVTLPAVAADVRPVWHQFVVRTPEREALRTHLAERGIAAGVLYPTPLHRQPAYAQPELHLPETEQACAEVLCLPVHPALSLADVDRVSDEILGWLCS
ncbi:DegT/DnrJ/EryC1/StrS family aminotransferase [Opitutus terrae]|uniref:DegT/DnrJ/EryC1/StrS aminotransferase n=1 Tax=Opitutus terrae (strain DSM 11246 / JCM 15787 / PB90-1) TaxID=452637 RepID=B1ZZT8_OPITP|nr:DegT/DnrJ/EryC1/StrS family aminotransferase [Opitutus terrae]ACB77274.1 DegT/DnrJ/EryC1/StrS aminotransferase [Opitutus terrae PB90-1]